MNSNPKANNTFEKKQREYTLIINLEDIKVKLVALLYSKA